MLSIPFTMHQSVSFKVKNVKAFTVGVGDNDCVRAVKCRAIAE